MKAANLSSEVIYKLFLLRTQLNNEYLKTTVFVSDFLFAKHVYPTIPTVTQVQGQGSSTQVNESGSSTSVSKRYSSQRQQGVSKGPPPVDANAKLYNPGDFYLLILIYSLLPCVIVPNDIILIFFS